MKVILLNVTAVFISNVQ